MQNHKTSKRDVTRSASAKNTIEAMRAGNPTRHSGEIHSPLGKLVIYTENNAVVKLEFVAHTPTTPSTLCTTAANELAAYFNNAKHKITIPVNPHGTGFQQRVWQALCSIPAGKTLTYGELARQLKTSARAIGQACKKNPIPIIVPCHRVVGANHQGGYMGKTEGSPANIKAWLLAHEKQT